MRVCSISSKPELQTHLNLQKKGFRWNWPNQSQNLTKSNEWWRTIIVTRHFFYKKMFMIKVIQNFMEITLCFNCFSEKTCWKMLFNILFSVSIFDTMFLFWFIGGCCLVAIAWSRIRLQMSTKKKSKFKLEELFSASSFGVCLYIKSDLHKILDNFYLKHFLIEETMSYDRN